MFLLLPTHRKFIKLLRDRANSGNPVITTKKDWADFMELVKTTSQRGARHQGLYRITLRAIGRSPEEIDPMDIHGHLDKRAVNLIERTLAKAEWKSFGATLKGAFLIPFFRSVLKRI